MSYVRQDKEKGVNVQVLLRCRPSSEEELKSNAPQVIVCSDARREVTVGQNIAGKQSDRTFTFDKVFGPQAQQKDLYEQAIVPIVQEVLEGFNCTIFAYGQTGTGKTYTMEGSGRRTINGELPPDAGVIPRAIEQIFDTLESQNAEYSVKATFLELYNEEITDFLAPEEAPKVMDEKQRKPLALMEDGKGGVLIRGLEEVIVTNAAEIFHLLERGTAKRRTAETLLNKQSSRSHSIFAITIHIKEATPEGEDLIKCGKLNLVDLAGSENISRSGAREGRAREAGEINKSLLTLGRVITSLVEHLGHVPYRDSKLTRLLRDSLGGRTKTCIIATVSPSVHCLEETLSTLDYAHRAKNIKNKPEVNQKMMKSTLIKELYSEIERLKLEVHASREKNGVYIPCERFYQEEADKKAMAEKIERLQEELEINHRQLEDMQARYDLEHQFCKELSTQLESSQKSMEQMKIAIDEEKEEIMQAHDKIAEKDYIIQSQQQSESVLLERAAIMHSELEQTVQDIMQLFAKIERKEKVEAGNLKLVQNFQSEFGDRLEALRKAVSASVLKQQEHLQIFEDQLQSFMSYKENSAEELKKKVEDLKLLYFSRLQSLHELALAHEKESNSVLDRASSVDCNYTSALQDLLRDAVLEAELVLRGLQTTLLNQQQEIALFAQQQREGTRKNVEMTKDVSQLTLDAFDHLCEQASELGMYIDESELAKGNYLTEFERTFEEQAKEEEQQLLQSISEILAKSKAKKSALVHSTVSTLRERSKRDKRHLEDGMARVGKLASESHSHWVSHMKEAEDTNDDMTALLAARHCRMEELLQDCVKGTENVGEHWRRTQTSLVHQTREHLPVIEAISRESMELNAHFRGLIDNGRLAAQSEFDSCSRDLLARIEGTLANECELESGLQLAVTSQKHSFANLQSCHHSKAEELQRYAMHLLGDNYLEDSLTSSTPPRRNISVPSKSSLEELRAPSIEALMKRYQECIRNDRMTTKALENLTTKQQPPKANGYSEAPRVRESRIPLARLN